MMSKTNNFIKFLWSEFKNHISLVAFLPTGVAFLTFMFSPVFDSDSFWSLLSQHRWILFFIFILTILFKIIWKLWCDKEYPLVLKNEDLIILSSEQRDFKEKVSSIIEKFTSQPSDFEERYKSAINYIKNDQGVAAATDFNGAFMGVKEVFTNSRNYLIKPSPEDIKSFKEEIESLEEHSRSGNRNCSEISLVVKKIEDKVRHLSSYLKNESN